MKQEASAATAGARTAGLSGTVWLVGWLFTVGFVRLLWWKALLGVVIWPYFLGAAMR